MKYLYKDNITLSTENWKDRMGDISIEEYAKENGFKITDKKPEQLLVRESKVDYENELIQIKKWFLENDYKINKITLGEWEASDARWTSYLAERKVKRARQDELIELLEG